ncbi:sirohydrochlorin chelatase [Herbaspirillum robiniae]|uniref:CbiX/SirB N-terminal domain-containing protein n=1 Tax=Herbaspirillum robiniae TaxID=2014887 RepID=A0A246WVZ1_9BURK|nr:CbiX/SirB N-terminal domain-containing protein [Herbaspirillum robiniae]NUU00880.1 CbiX/SirB N-terminal domain-containing protein [Herbaspirillum robiniae]OWY31247.1 cobalamin biosynthesis protein CbiX [Herbaspirillum robiniae]
MSSTSVHSLILFAHGARDPAWAAPFERLRALAQAAMPGAGVRLAFLELMQPGLPEAAALEIAAGAQRITVVPVFLGQGGHVRRDLPQLLEQLRQAHPQVRIDAVPAAGEDEAVLQAIAAYCVAAVRT